MNNPNIYNVEEDNRLSPGLQPLTTESELKIFFSPDMQMYFIIQEIILLSSTKQNSQVLNIFE